MMQTVQINIFLGTAVPAILTLLSFFAVFRLSRKAAKHGRLGLSLFPLVIWTALFYFVLVRYGKGFIYPISYYLNAGVPNTVSVGQIEHVLPGPCAPVYFDPVTFEFSRGQFVIMGENTYFYPGNCLQTGQWVELRYIDNENVICEWSEAAAGTETAPRAIGTDLPSVPAPIEAGPSPLARAVWYVSFAMFVLAVLGQKIFGGNIAALLQKKDSTYPGGIQPSLLGIAMYACFLVPIYGMLFGWWMNGASGFLLVGTIAGIIFLGIIVIKQTTCATYSRQQLIVKKLGKSRCYPIGQIRAVEWKQTSVSFCRRLVITLQDHSTLSFEQEYFWGLTSMYASLNKDL